MTRSQRWHAWEVGNNTRPLQRPVAYVAVWSSLSTETWAEMAGQFTDGLVVLPTLSEGWGRGGTPRTSNSRATPQGLDQRWKTEVVVPKMARRRGSEEGRYRRWVRSCRRCPQALQKEFAFRLSSICTRRLWPWQRSRDSLKRTRRGRASSLEETKGIWQKRELWKISSPRRAAGVSNLCNDRDQWTVNMGKGECYFGFGERVCQFITGKSSVTGNPLEA